MISNFELTRTHAAHIGSSPLVSRLGDTPVTEVSEGRKNVQGTFENYLVEAVDYVNNKQMASAANVEKLITDPDSVDVHDVTIAMGKAQMSLSLAQNVIERLLSGWNEIQMNR